MPTLYMPDPASVKLIECSPPSWAVEIALDEKGLPFKRKLLSFAKAEHRAPEMLALNPRGTVPIFTDGDAVLYETVAMLQYLEAAYPDPALMPRRRVLAATALNRLHEADNLKKAGMQLFAYLMRHDEAEREAQQMEEMTAAFHRELAHWERYYGQHPWAAGATLSLADILVFVYVATAVHLGLELEASYPNLKRAHDHMRERPSVQKRWPQTWSSHNYEELRGKS